MKRYLLGIVFVIVGALNVLAQSEHKMSFGVGILSHPYNRQFLFSLMEDLSDYPDDNDHGTYKFQDKIVHSFPLTTSLHYECSVGKHFAFGLCFAYDYMRMEHHTEVWTSVGDEISDNGEIHTIWDRTYESGSIYSHIFNIMPEVTIYWFKKRHVALYSQISAGLRFNVEKETIYCTHAETASLTEHHFTCQVSPVCAEFGGPVWRGFAEFGYGAQGIYQLGVKHIFQGIN